VVFGTSGFSGVFAADRRPQWISGRNLLVSRMVPKAVVFGI
jgi:hypothetical protein